MLLASLHFCSSVLQERYYREKLGVDPRDPAARRKVVEDYIQARPSTPGTASPPNHAQFLMPRSAGWPSTLRTAIVSLVAASLLVARVNKGFI